VRIQCTADGSYTLYSEAYQQSFHSHRGARAEAEHVFLRGSGVASRLIEGRATEVLEVGFGTGLNFLLTAELARRWGTPLYYVALERELLPAATLEALRYRELLEDSFLLTNLLSFRRELPARPAPGRYRCAYSDRLICELRIGDATLGSLEQDAFHAVYQDAFSPEANPELWSESFLGALYGSLRPAGRLASYCVKGTVRRRLSRHGFAVTKRPGPPEGKREVLVATKASPSASMQGGSTPRG
jgi:tRNA U34 5-methylaminomethyl-2-thiouridine-forming methyltransferase MnmC